MKSVAAAFSMALAVLSGGAVAQTNSCMGNCLASEGDTPGYHACIRRLCNANHVQPSTHIPTWNGGAIQDGAILWAGIDTQNGQSGLYYFCQQGGISDLLIPGTPPGQQTFYLTVDGQTFEKTFRTISNGVTATVVPEEPLIRAMRGGKGVVIESQRGGMVMGLPLINAEEALEGALVGCGFMEPDERPLGAGERQD